MKFRLSHRPNFTSHYHLFLLFSFICSSNLCASGVHPSLSSNHLVMLLNLESPELLFCHLLIRIISVVFLSVPLRMILCPCLRQLSLFIDRSIFSFSAFLSTRCVLYHLSFGLWFSLCNYPSLSLPSSQSPSPSPSPSLCLSLSLPLCNYVSISISISISKKGKNKCIDLYLNNQGPPLNWEAFSWSAESLSILVILGGGS